MDAGILLCTNVNFVSLTLRIGTALFGIIVKFLIVKISQSETPDSLKNINLSKKIKKMWTYSTAQINNIDQYWNPIQ